MDEYRDHILVQSQLFHHWSQRQKPIHHMKGNDPVSIYMALVCLRRLAGNEVHRDGIPGKSIDRECVRWRGAPPMQLKKLSSSLVIQ